MASAYVVLTLLFTIFEITTAQHHQHQLKSICIGSSLPPSRQPNSWHSFSGRFEFGFYKQGSGFSVGIWLVTSNIKIVWTANRDEPPVLLEATPKLTTDGKLILSMDGSEDKVIADPPEAASSASMLDSGNFVLYNNRFVIIWKSFNTPTDTILGGQSLYAGKQLLSSVSETNSSTGQFCLNMQADGNLVLYSKNTIDENTDVYWGSNTGNHQQLHQHLDNTGPLLLLNSSTSVIWTLYCDSSGNNNGSVIHRATLGHDGILHLYSHYFNSEGIYNTSVKLEVPEDLCHVKTFCGLNSYCTWYDNQPMRSCLPGTDFLNTIQISSGCARNFVEERCRNTNRSAAYNMTSMVNITWDDYPYFRKYMLEEECRKSCLEDCECDAALYESGYCMKHKLPLKSARRHQGESSSSKAYFKTSIRTIKSNVTLSDRITSNKEIVLILVRQNH